VETPPIAPQPGPSAVLRRIEATGWAILCILCLGTLAALPPAHAAGLALGGLLALGNLRLMDLYFARILRRQGARPRWWHHALYAARFFALLGALAALLAWGRAPVLSVVVGLSVPLMAISLYGARAALRGGAAARV